MSVQKKNKKQRNVIAWIKFPVWGCDTTVNVHGYEVYLESFFVNFKPTSMLIRITAEQKTSITVKLTDRQKYAYKVKFDDRWIKLEVWYRLESETAIVVLSELTK
jgi:hypothetical protein